MRMREEPGEGGEAHQQEATDLLQRRVLPFVDSQETTAKYSRADQRRMPWVEHEESARRDNA